MTEVIPLAYKFRAKKDGIISEFLALKDISLEDAENKIKDFLEYFKPISIRKEIIGAKPEIEVKKEGEKEKEYSASKDRWALLPDFMKIYPKEFTKDDYANFMISKGIKFKRDARANDDLYSLKNWKIIDNIDHRWRFIATEEIVKSIIDERINRGNIVVKASIPNPRQREYMMYKNMADEEYFTLIDWIKFMTNPPNNYEERRIKNNFYHDIANLLSAGKLKEIKTEDNNSYYPKRYKVIKMEPQAVEDRMIKDLKDGQKVLMGTIKD
jgi:hypothetical protein